MRVEEFWVDKNLPKRQSVIVISISGNEKRREEKRRDAELASHTYTYTYTWPTLFSATLFLTCANQVESQHPYYPQSHLLVQSQMLAQVPTRWSSPLPGLGLSLSLICVFSFAVHISISDILLYLQAE